MVINIVVATFYVCELEEVPTNESDCFIIKGITRQVRCL